MTFEEDFPSFEKKELHEIERMADREASMLVHQFADTINKLSSAKTTSLSLMVPDGKGGQFIDRLLEEHIVSYDLYRTIGAKARKMQEEKEQ